MAKQEEQINNGFVEIDNLLDLSQFNEQWFKPEDFYGIPVIYRDHTMKTGDKGDYAVIDMLVEASGEPISVSTGASQIVSVVKALKQANLTNVRFTFAKEGDRKLIVKAPML